MRRLYIVPKSVWFEAAMQDTFHPREGSHYFDLDATHILLCASFSHEGAEDRWHAHPDVVILPDPMFEGNDPIAKFIHSPTKKLKTSHIAMLAGHATLGFAPADTVLDLGRKAAAIHPLVKLRAVL